MSIQRFWETLTAYKDHTIRRPSSLRLKLRIGTPAGRAMWPLACFCNSDKVWQSILKLLQDFPQNRNRCRVGSYDRMPFWGVELWKWESRILEGFRLRFAGVEVEGALHIPNHEWGQPSSWNSPVVNVIIALHYPHVPHMKIDTYEP
jgi:hypothetical protein